jgi:hypothetical protein
MIRRLIGGIIFKVGWAAGKCLAVFLIHKILKEIDVMLKVDNGNGQQVSFWGALGQIALAGFASWGMSKMADPDKTGWVPYRNQMLGNMAGTAMTFAMQQMQAVQQTAAQPEQQTVPPEQTTAE